VENAEDALATIAGLKEKIINIVAAVEAKSLSEGQKDLDSVAAVEAAGKNVTGITLEWFNYASDKFYAMQDKMHTIRDDLVAKYETMEAELAAIKASAEDQLEALSTLESSSKTEADKKTEAEAIRTTSRSLKKSSSGYETEARSDFFKAVTKLALILGPAAVRNQITHASLYLYLLSVGVTTSTTEAATITAAA